MEQLTTADGQVVMQAVQSVGPQQVQVMQMNPSGQVIQGANGQQIMVHTMPQNGQIQVAPGTQGIQQIQVVPVSSLQTGQGQILLQQPQQAQIVQTADGQTFIYQPVALDNTLQQATPTGRYNKFIYPISDNNYWNVIVLNINGNLVQLTTNPQATTTATVSQPAVTSPTPTVVPQSAIATAAAPNQLAMANGNLVMVRNSSDVRNHHFQYSHRPFRCRSSIVVVV